MEAWQATVQDEAGNAVFNPVVTVYESDGVTLASIFNEDGSPKDNPFTGSLEGFAQFWAGPGVYKIRGANGGQTELWESDLGGLGVADEALATADSAFATQVRRDFGKWHLTDYLHPDDMAAALEGNIAGQDEGRVTAAIQQMNDDAMEWWRGGNARVVETILPPVRLAINDEYFSQTHAGYVWDLPHGNNRWIIRADNTELFLRNWTGRTAVRTTGYYAAQGISYPVERAVLRWERSQQNGVFPRIEGGLTIRSPGSIDHDPVGVKLYNGSEIKIGNLRVVGLRNHQVIPEGLFNGYFDGLSLGGGGYQPTEFGGDYGLLSGTVRFSNAGPVVVATEAVFAADHVGRYFALNGAGPLSGATRLIYWSTIASVDSPTQITLAAAPDTDVTDEYGSFEAMRASVTASGTTWTMSAPLAADMTGRLVTLVGTRGVGKPATRGTLTTRIRSHVGDVVEVADAAAVAVTDGLMVFSPQLLVDQIASSSDSGNTDNISFTAPRFESARGAQNATIQAVLGSYTTGAMSDAKMHGHGASQNNFGGSAANVILGRVQMDYGGMLTQSGNSPRWGCIMAVGGSISANFAGHIECYPFSTDTAIVYCNPITTNAEVNIRMGMPVMGGNFPTANQVGMRLGPNGSDDMVTTIGSDPRGNSGSLFLTKLGRVSADSLETPYHKQVKTTVSGGTGNIKLPMPQFTSWVVRGTAVVRQSGGPARKGFTFTGMIGRAEFVGSTGINGTPTVTVVADVSGGPGYTVDLAADTTIGGLSIDLTGNGEWMVDLTIVEARV